MLVRLRWELHPLNLIRDAELNMLRIACRLISVTITE
jgi:hypothetical protein